MLFGLINPSTVKSPVRCRSLASGVLMYFPTTPVFWKAPLPNLTVEDSVVAPAAAVQIRPEASEKLPSKWSNAFVNGDGPTPAALSKPSRSTTGVADAKLVTIPTATTEPGKNTQLDDAIVSVINVAPAATGPSTTSCAVRFNPYFELIVGSIDTTVVADEIVPSDTEPKTASVIERRV